MSHSEGHKGHSVTNIGSLKVKRFEIQSLNKQFHHSMNLSSSILVDQRFVSNVIFHHNRGYLG